MKTSEHVDKIGEALANAQSLIGTVTLNKINPHFQSKYADLSAIREACKDALAKHGIALVQSPEVREGRALVITRLIHKSGQWIENELSLKPDRGDTPQAIGSAITYARRYALASLLGIVADEDDDGNAAEGSRLAGSKRAPAPQPTKKIYYNAKDPAFIAKIEELLARRSQLEKKEAVLRALDGIEAAPGRVEQVLDITLKQL